MMQKFVIKKITRSTNITIEDQNFLDAQVLNDDENLEAASVRMCGYLKKKRNFGWQKLYFVLQNGLLMSYNSKEEYERKLVSFKDIICLIPGTTILLPSLEPRFTIASNLNTFYTFRCDNQQVCSKWITAILECLSRDIKSEFIGKKSITKSFRSQQNLNSSSTQTPTHMSCQSRQPTNHSWENLLPGSNSNWLVNHNGRILLELNYMNCNRAKLPIASQTAKILKNVGSSDVIRTTKKINFVLNDENQNTILKNGSKVEDENKTYATHQHNPKKPDQFRLHNESNLTEKKSRIVNRISKIFPASSSTSSSSSSVVAVPESESQRPNSNNDNFLMQSNGIENGIEEQQLELSFGEEYSMFSITGDYASVDSSRFNNKLNIENIYSEIKSNNGIYAVPNVTNKSNSKWIKSSDVHPLPEYSVIDLSKKYEERSRKNRQKELSGIAESEGEEKLNIMVKNLNIYEDVEIAKAKNSNIKNDETIYELIDIPLRPSRKTRSLVWKNWSRIHIFSLFKDNPSDISMTTSSSCCSDATTNKKRAKLSLTLTNFNFSRHYRSVRNKARKICRKSHSTSALNADQILDHRKI